MEQANEEWLRTSGYYHIKKLSDHYGVYEHLFGDAYFLPVVPLCVNYTKADVKHSVYFGNLIKPSDAETKPEVHYESEKEALWSLILTNPDGHFTKQDQEYIHWFV